MNEISVGPGRRVAVRLHGRRLRVCDDAVLAPHPPHAEPTRRHAAAAATAAAAAAVRNGSIQRAGPFCQHDCA